MLLMLDVCFAVCTNFRSAIRTSLDTKVGQMLKEGHGGACARICQTARRPGGFPAISESRMREALSSKIDMLHHAWDLVHNSTDYP
ncbi:hypothetical protein M405DRAFT_894034 [Rhizopogon salebrosus TDB-379]|nr:hypothetical protein M405DRAFT_894034 [Rhizopogon salebrosus TDB-379]